MENEMEVANALVEGGEEVQEQEQTPVADESGEGEQQSGEDKPHKRLGGWQRKIQRLEQENEVLRDMALRSKPEPTKVDAKADETGKPVKPVLDKYATYDEYESAKDAYNENLAEWKAKKAVEQYKTANEQAKAQESINSRWNEKQAVGRKAHSDFDEVVSNPDLRINVAMRDVILDSEVGEELAYYLGTHESECNRLAGLSPLLAARELGKLEAGFARQNQAEEKPPISRAPAPIQRVQKSSSANIPRPDLPDSDAMPADDWLKARNAQLAKKNAR